MHEPSRAGCTIERPNAINYVLVHWTRAPNIRCFGVCAEGECVPGPENYHVN
jgi:hypothetical protein